MGCGSSTNTSNDQLGSITFATRRIRTTTQEFEAEMLEEQSRSHNIIESRRAIQEQVALEMQTPIKAPPINSPENKTECPFFIHPSTLRLRTSKRHQKRSFLVFKYDSQIEAQCTVYFGGKDIVDEECNSVRIEWDRAKLPQPVEFSLTAGVGLKLPKRKVLFDRYRFEENLLLGKIPDTYPIVIELKPLTDFSSSIDSLITCAIFLKTDDTKLHVELQKVKVSGRSFQINEIYGLDAQETETEEKCVICLTNQKSTLVMPCRHMCLCTECAEEARVQENAKCPICRQKIANLIKIGK